MAKKQKSIGGKALSNRTIIGIICLVVALAICFGIAPLVNKISDGKTLKTMKVKTNSKGVLKISTKGLAKKSYKCIISLKNDNYNVKNKFSFKIK